MFCLSVRAFWFNVKNKARRVLGGRRMGAHMDTMRHVMAEFLIVILPLVILFWGMVHIAPAFWRRRGMTVTYTVAFLLLACAAAALFYWRDAFLGRDLGTNWFLFVIGAVVYVIALVADRHTRRFLDFRTFAGVPELKGEAGTLLQSGPFAAVRHPRYTMVLVGVVAWSMMVNHTGTYALAALFALGLWGIVQLEERDLRQRFGAAYGDYAKRVPQLLPRLSDVGLFFK